MLIFIFFPQIASTSLGQRFFIQGVQSKTHTHVAANQISLSWLGPQKFYNLSFESEDFKGNLEQLSIGVRLWSLLPLFEFKNLSQIKGDIKIVNTGFEFDSKQLPSVQLDSIQGILRFHDGGVDFTTDGKANQNGKTGTFTLQGQIKNFQESLPEFSIRGEWVSFPTLPIARILSSRNQIDENKIVQLIGVSLDLQGSASFIDNQGLFEINIHAPNIDSSINGNIVNHDLTLLQPLTATLHLTPEFSQWILRDVNPLLVTGVEAKSPIHLRIEPSQFRCPLFPFQLEHLQIGQGTLDIGQLRCLNEGSLAALMSFLKNKTFSSSQEMNIWFTPLFFSLRDGILKTSRIDFLIDQTIHLCSWGNIDYLRGQLDMFVGLPAETLQQSFGIGKLPSDYVMKIALTGTMKNPKLATHAAAAKIAALLTTQQSSYSWLTNGILGIFDSSDDSVPPPHRPFPWE